jgi:galactoside 2-L-fucosyltransferase 1/2
MSNKHATFEDLAIPQDQGAKLAGPHGGAYLQSYKYFENVPSGPMMEALAFLPPVQAAANEFMAQFAGTTESPSVIVGIHVRHGDLVNIGYINFPVDSFFEGAMARFRDKYGAGVQFVVASDEIGWCAEQSYFKDPNVHLTSASNSPSIDMAIMASCDHFIVSVGTFGWWCAWLGAHQRGGDVIFYDKEFVMDHPINRGNVVKADYFPPTWIGMS